ncbi:hypothetical protein DFH29DRAFT_1007548 [Suillus ampliporus]|nr:hypothetical protein DFH29DRAFT_1007548 [Suillus ampliporus]
MELMHAMRESIDNAAESGIVAWDCKFDEEVMLVPSGLFVVGDNPMQAEECSHAGLNCNYFCRTCHVGGMKEYKESEVGYNSIFTEGNLRTPEETTLQLLQRQLEFRDSISSSLINTLVELGKKLRKRDAGQLALAESEVRAKLEKELEHLLQSRMHHDTINPLLGMDGLNIHLDTPTEILHTVLLGVMKYFWGQTVFLLEKAKLLTIFQTHLGSLETDGLNALSLNADYICHYKGGLIGKHFKSLAQIMPFTVYDLVPKSVLDGWTTIGELVILIWHTKINNTESYLAVLSRKISDFLNVTAQCAPSILISKLKFHFLVHLPAFIRRFGPVIIFSTERYESFNHDTCTMFVRNDTIKHIATGGYWYDADAERWVQGGPGVVTFLEDHPEHARLLGIPNENLADPGTGTILTTERSKRDIIPWEINSLRRNTQEEPFPKSFSYSLLPGDFSCDLVSMNIRRWMGMLSFKTQSRRRCTFACVIAGKIPTTIYYQTHIGCIREILISTTTQRTVAFVALQVFSIMPACHPLLHLPCLVLSDKELVVSGMDIVCAVNLQHNCLDAKCTDLSTKHVWQERTQTDQTTSIIEHRPSPHYLLNTFSIHNYEHIHSLLPESLRETPLRVADPGAVQKAAVKQMQGKRLAKKSGGEVAILPNDEDVVQPAFDHGSKKQAKAKTTGKKKQQQQLLQQRVCPILFSSHHHTFTSSRITGPHPFTEA